MTSDSSERNTGSAFPLTRVSVVAGVRSDDPEVRRRAYATLLESYWRPVYTYLRLRWRRNPDDAQDLTQEFLTRTFEKDYLARYDAERARLRTFLRVCLDRFVQNHERDAGRVKRGGQVQMVRLDFETAEGDLARLDPPDPRQGEAFFEREWVRGFFALVVEALHRECAEKSNETRFRLFERYDLDEEAITYDDLAREHGLRVTDVTNQLAAARRAFRRLALERLRELTASDEEFRAEARALLGGDPT